MTIRSPYIVVDDEAPPPCCYRIVRTGVPCYGCPEFISGRERRPKQEERDG